MTTGARQVQTANPGKPRGFGGGLRRLSAKEGDRVTAGLAPGDTVLRPARLDAELEEGRRVRVRLSP